MVAASQLGMLNYVKCGDGKDRCPETDELLIPAETNLLKVVREDRFFVPGWSKLAALYLEWFERPMDARIFAEMSYHLSPDDDFVLRLVSYLAENVWKDKT